MEIARMALSQSCYRRLLLTSVMIFMQLGDGLRMFGHPLRSHSRYSHTWQLPSAMPALAHLPSSPATSRSGPWTYVGPLQGAPLELPPADWMPDTNAWQYKLVQITFITAALWFNKDFTTRFRQGRRDDKFMSQLKGNLTNELEPYGQTTVRLGGFAADSTVFWALFGTLAANVRQRLGPELMPAPTWWPVMLGSVCLLATWGFRRWTGGYIRLCLAHFYITTIASATRPFRKLLGGGKKQQAEK